MGTSLGGIYRIRPLPYPYSMFLFLGRLVESGKIIMRICPIAWDLYDKWTQALTARARMTPKEIREARNAYIEHRKNCPNCDPIVSKVAVENT
jgi:hypothetical protein